MSPTPNTDSADKTFDFTGIPVGSTINSATLTATMNSPATGAALRTVDGGAFSGSKGVSITAGGYNTFRFRFKANGTTSAPYGDRSSTLSFSDVTITVDYTPPGGGGGGTPPPATNIGTLSVSPSSITAGGSFLTTLGPAEAYITRKVSIYRNDNGAFLDSVVVGHGSGQDSWYYTVPIAWCEFAPNDTQFSLLIQLYAEKPGGLWGGVAYQTVNVLIPEDIKPTIGSLSAAYNANGVNGAITKYVQNYSKVDLAMGSVAGIYGSSIVSYEITGGGLSALSSAATLGPFSQVGNISFTAKVVDSRGRVGTKTVAINVEPYSPPTFSIPEAWRSNYDGVKNQKGSYVRLKSGVSFSSIGGQNAATLKGRVYIKGGTEPVWSSMTPGQALILGGGALLFTRTYIAQIQVSDLLEIRITEFIIPTKKTGISIMAGMLGAAIGKSAETPGILDVAWPIVAPNFYPIGSIYMSINSTSPATLFGGTWAAIDAGRFLVAAGTGYSVGGTGGQSSVSLTRGNLPDIAFDVLAQGNGSNTWGLPAPTAQGTAGLIPGYVRSGGSGDAISIIPPWFAINVWRRTA